MFQKRKLLFPLGFIVILSITLFFVGQRKVKPMVELKEICDDLLYDRLSSNSLLSHFSMKDTNGYFQTKEETPVTLPNYSYEKSLEYATKLENVKVRLQGISIENSKLLQCEKDSLCYFVDKDLKLQSYPYFDSPFSPYDGVQSELPILLTEYAFTNREDIDEYFQILELIPAYLESLCQYEKERINHGISMPNAVFCQAYESLCYFKTLKDENNPLLLSFATRLDALEKSDIIDAKLKKNYIDRNQKLVTSTVIPALCQCAVTLDDLYEHPDIADSVIEYPAYMRTNEYKEYYTLLLQSTLSEDYPVSYYKKIYTESLSASFEKLQSLVSDHADFFNDFSSTYTVEDPLCSLSANDCVSYLNKCMQKDFPYASPSKNTKQKQNVFSYEIKDVPTAMESLTNPAYYFTAPIDAPFQNIIYINNSSTTPGIALFTTLAHESFPGHLYQHAYDSYQNSTGIPSLSSICGCNGFTEGYATYVEFLSYDYAKELAKSQFHNEEVGVYYDYMKLQRELYLNFYSLLDIMIHYESATIEDLTPYFQNMGITDREQMETVYTYILSTPCTYITYFGGYEQILSCKELAKRVYGNSYNEKNFHKLLLTFSSCSFDSIKQIIKEIKYAPLNFQYF